MPYIITTYPEPTMAPGFVGTRHAVATLDEAREHAFGRMVEDRRREDAFDIPADGGTIGPLPDGTVIAAYNAAQ